MDEKEEEEEQTNRRVELFFIVSTFIGISSLYRTNENNFVQIEFALF